MFMTYTVRFDETTGNLRPWEVVMHNSEWNETNVIASCATQEAAIKSALKKVATQNKAYRKEVAQYAA